MKLDRTKFDHGKYALVKNRRVREIMAKGDGASDDLKDALAVLREMGVLDESPEGSTGEFFVIRLRDIHAAAALSAYSEAADLTGDGELSYDVRDLAMRAGLASPFCKKPD